MRELITSILARYFSLVPIPPSLSAVLNAEHRCVVVIRYQALVFRALLLSFARRSGFDGIRPCSLGQFDASDSSSSHLLYCSVDESKELLHLAEKDPSFRYSTMNLYRGRGPTRSSPRFRLNLWETLGVLIGPILHCRFLLVLFGKPLPLPAEVLHSGRRITRFLKLDFYRNLKMVRGTPFQNLDAQESTVLGGREVERELTILATRMGLPKWKLHRKARREFRKMAAHPKTLLYVPAVYVCRILVNRLFTQVVTRGLDRFAESSKEHPVVLIPMHRSHLDYILLGYMLYESNLNPPLVAAGINLNFWPAGWIIRSLGAYFVKRDARSDRIHALLLRRYVTYLMKRGHLQEFFIEGGRSRSGKMRPPKLGLLSILVSAFQKGARKDVLFVPVSITYEHVIEEGVYGDEDSGKAKTKENLWALLRARKIFDRKYGEVVLHFGEPISLAEQLKNHSETTPKAGAEKRTFLSQLGLHVTRKIRNQCSVSLTGLAFTALTMSPKYGLRSSVLRTTVSNLAQISRLMKELDPDLGDYTESLQRFLNAGERTSLDIFSHSIVERTSYLGEEVLMVRGQRRFVANFYRNATIHIYVPIAILSLSDLLDSNIQMETVRELHSIFEHDLLLSSWTEFEEKVQRILEILGREKIVRNTDAGLHFSNCESGIYTPSLLLSSIQSYLWVLRHLEKLPGLEESMRDEQTEDLSKKSFLHAEFLKALQSHGVAGKYLSTLTCTESLSKSSLTAVLEALRNQRSIDITEGASSSKLIQVKSLNLNHIQLLERANSAILRWQIDHSGFQDS